MLKFANIVLEITKKCNLRCAHCLRGEPENEELNLEILPKIFNENIIIQNLEFTGGEVFFNPQLLNKIVDYIINSGVTIFSCGIITNGTSYTKEIEEIIKKLDLYIKNCTFRYFGIDKSQMCIELSVDEYHQEEMSRIKKESYNLYKKYMDNIKILMLSDFFDSYRENDKIINLGRAKNLNIQKYEPCSFEIYYTNNTFFDNDVIEVSGIEVNLDGEIKYANNDNVLTKNLKDIVVDNGQKCDNMYEYELMYEKDIKKVINLKLSN